MFLFICLLSGLLIGILGITYKLVSKKGYDGDNFRIVLSCAAAAFSLVALILAREEIFNRLVILVGALCGLSFFLAVVMIMRAMEIGPVAFTWVLINLSIVIPIFASAIIWSEPIRHAQWLGIGFFALSLMLFGRDLKGDEDRGLTLKWMLIAAAMFLANGVMLLFFKVIDKYSGSPHTFLTLLTLYVVSGILFAGYKRKLGLPRGGELKLGLLAAACMMGGQALIIKALAINTASALPIIHSTSIIVVAVLSAIMLGEGFSKFSGSGLVCGIISMILLTLG